jgi:hypothetical protein
LQTDALLQAGVLRYPHPRERASAFVGAFPVLKKNGLCRVVGDEGIKDLVTLRCPVGVMGPREIAVVVASFDTGIVTDAAHYFYQLPIHPTIGPAMALDSPRGVLYFAKAIQGDRLVPAYSQAVSRVVLRKAVSGLRTSAAVGIYDDYLIATSDHITQAQLIARIQETARYFNLTLKQALPAEDAVVAGCQISFLRRTIRPEMSFCEKFAAHARHLGITRTTVTLTIRQTWALAGCTLWLLAVYQLPTAHAYPLVEHIGHLSTTIAAEADWDRLARLPSAPRDVVLWALSLASTRQERVLRLSPERPLIPVATDASITAACMMTEGWVSWWPLHIAAPLIFLYELLTAILAICYVVLTAPGSRVHLFLDNQGAQLALNKRYARHPLAASALAQLDIILHEQNATLCTSYVDTLMNPADIPTRPPWPTKPAHAVPYAALPSHLTELLAARPSPRSLLCALERGEGGVGG